MPIKLLTEKVRLSFDKLNSDGVVTDLFHCLWKHSTNDGPNDLGICIPDTIVFSYSAPMWWYFTAFNKKKEARIMRKNRINVTRENIVKSFCSPKAMREKRPAVKGAPVVATHLRLAQRIRDSDREHVIIEYFTKSELIRFLKRRDIPDGSVLQRFVISSGQHTDILRATWSPSISTVECRTNVFSMFDRRKTLHERLCTYEGSPELSNERSIIRSDSQTTESHSSRGISRSKSSNSINRRGMEALSKCETTIRQIHDVFAAATGQDIQVTRLQTFFRVDKKERMWLLWCSSCRAKEHGMVMKKLKHAESLGSLLSNVSATATQKRVKLKDNKNNINKSKSLGQIPGVNSLAIKKTYTRGSKLADALCPSPYYTTPEQSISFLAKKASANVQKSERYTEHLNELFSMTGQHPPSTITTAKDTFLPDMETKNNLAFNDVFPDEDNIENEEKVDERKKKKKKRRLYLDSNWSSFARHTLECSRKEIIRIQSTETRSLCNM